MLVKDFLKAVFPFILNKRRSIFAKKTLMRKTLLFIALGYSAGVVAQPTLTTFYGVGTSFEQRMISAAAAGTIDAISSGAAATWNYPNLTQTEVIEINCVAPAGQPGASNFPGSDFAASIDGGSGEVSTSYFNVSGSAASLNGVYFASADGSISMEYNPALDFVQLPFTFNSTFTQSINALLTADIGTILLIYREGTQTVLCDGYGTLVTPAGTFNDVLRIKTTQSFQDSLNFMGLVQIEQNEVVTINWISPALNGMSLLHRTESTLNGQTTVNGFWVDPGSVGINKFSTSAVLSVYPNPSSGNITVNMDGFANENVSVDIYSVTGQLVGNLYKGAATSQNINLNVKSDNISAGSYILKVTSANHIASKPLLIF